MGKHQTDTNQQRKETAAEKEQRKRRLILSEKDLKREIRSLEELMQQAVKDFDFIAAAKYRDEVKELKELLKH
jgi:excinuclease ABC subunit B